MDLRSTSRMPTEWDDSDDGRAVAADDPYEQHKRARLVEHRVDGRPIALRTAELSENECGANPRQHWNSGNAYCSAIAWPLLGAEDPTASQSSVVGHPSALSSGNTPLVGTSAICQVEPFQYSPSSNASSKKSYSGRRPSSP